MDKKPKYLTLKEECKNCKKYQKSYCVGTFLSEKGLKCAKVFSNGSKYRAIKSRMNV